MRRQRAATDLRVGNSVQRLRLVRDGLREQRFLVINERRRRRLPEIRKVGKIREVGEIGKQIERDQIVRKIFERKIHFQEGQKVAAFALSRRYSFNPCRYIRNSAPNSEFFSAISTVAFKNPSLSPASCVFPS